MDFLSFLCFSSNFYVFPLIPMHFLQFLCISSHFYGFPLISMHFLSFLWMSSHCYAFPLISMNFPLFLWVSSDFYGSHLIRALDAETIFLFPQLTCRGSRITRIYLPAIHDAEQFFFYHNQPDTLGYNK